MGKAIGRKGDLEVARRARAFRAGEQTRRQAHGEVLVERWRALVAARARVGAAGSRQATDWLVRFGVADLAGLDEAQRTRLADEVAAVTAGIPYPGPRDAPPPPPLALPPAPARDDVVRAQEKIRAILRRVARRDELEPLEISGGSRAATTSFGAVDGRALPLAVELDPIVYRPTLWWEPSARRWLPALVPQGPQGLEALFWESLHAHADRIAICQAPRPRAAAPGDVCGRPFVAWRSDKEFCSSTCKLRVIMRRYRSRRTRRSGAKRPQGR